MNPYDTLETLAAVVVPGLADWSYVIHRGWDGGSALVASAAGDPAQAGAAGVAEQVHARSRR